MMMGKQQREPTPSSLSEEVILNDNQPKFLPVVPREKRIRLLGGSSSVNPTHQCGTKGLMRGARGLIPTISAMVLFPP